MKKFFLIANFLFFSVLVNAQTEATKIEVGDVLTIHTPENSTFLHVHFPPKNLIIKRGGIADMKSVHGTRVVVTALEDKKGRMVAVLKRVDGRKFFKHLRAIDTDLQAALKAGELKS